MQSDQADFQISGSNEGIDEVTLRLKATYFNVLQYRRSTRTVLYDSFQVIAEKP